MIVADVNSVEHEDMKMVVKLKPGAKTLLKRDPSRVDMARFAVWFLVLIHDDGFNDFVDFVSEFSVQSCPVAKSMGK